MIKVFQHDRVKTKRTTMSMMIEFTICVALVFIAALVYYGVSGVDDAGKYILRMFLNLLVSMGTVYAIETANLAVRYHKTLKVKEIFLNPITKEFFFATPLILVLLFPVYTPIYVIFVSALIASLVAKVIFGGFGSNIFNPALAGRIFAGICFSGQISNASVVQAGTNLTISTGATLTTINQASGFVNETLDISLKSLFLGTYHGAIGETFAGLIILIGIYLSVRKIIDWKMSLTYVVAFFIISLFMGVTADKGLGSFEFALRQCLYGAVLFGAVFCITDPVTSPVMSSGRIYAAFLGAFVCACIRYLGSAPEGVGYSILLVNLCTPAIDRILSNKSNHRIGTQYIVMAGLTVMCIGLGCGIGAYLSGKMSFLNSVETILPFINGVFAR
ncbi:MAG: RnfABCDGE type electron transport complex subunit D [Bacilli bacterium]